MAQYRGTLLALGVLTLVAAPTDADATMVTLTVPVRCDVRVIGADVDRIEAGTPTEIGSINGSCNVPHVISLTTPQWGDYRGEFVYEGASEPFAMGRTTFRKLEGARIYLTPLWIVGDPLDESRTEHLMSSLTVMPAL